jgi:hypothetical protein
LVVRLEPPLNERHSFRVPALLSFPLAALLAVCALGGILLPAVYAREHPNWAAQGLRTPDPSGENRLNRD